MTDANKDTTAAGKPQVETTGGVRATFRSFVNNAFTSRRDLLNHLFDPRRDIDEECGYPKNITAQQYRVMYDREGVATRVVAVFPEECWRTDPSIYEIDDANTTAWEATLNAVLEEHNLFAYLNRVDELSGIGSFGVLLLGIDDGLGLEEPVEGIILDGPNAGRKVGFEASTASAPEKDPGKKKKPLSRVSARVEGGESMVAAPVETKRHLLYLRALDESLVQIAEWENDPTSRRFGMPKAYNIQFTDPRNQTSGSGAAPDCTSRKVHWTRILHVADNTSSSEVFGTPRMQNVFNRLYDLRKLLGGSAEMFWKGAFPGFAFEVNPDMADMELDRNAMRTEFEAYANGLQRYLALSGVSAKSLDVQVASPNDHVMVQLNAIAITIGCPLRIFMGSEAAHLASTQDQMTWNGRLSHRQVKYLTPKLIRPFIDRLIAMDVLPEPEAGEYNVVWPDLNTTTAGEKATVSEVLMRCVASYMQSGADALIPPFEFLTVFLGMEPEQAKAMIDAAKEELKDKDIDDGDDGTDVDDDDGTDVDDDDDEDTDGGKGVDEDGKDDVKE